MASCSIRWKLFATNELRKLPKDSIARVLGAVEQLATNPLPQGTRKLTGSERSYRLREGNYRIIYTIEVDELVIEIVRVGHRKDVCRS
jgi:mRNA interferase RelE/StbE